MTETGNSHFWALPISLLCNISALPAHISYSAQSDALNVACASIMLGETGLLISRRDHSAFNVACASIMLGKTGLLTLQEETILELNENSFHTCHMLNAAVRLHQDREARLLQLRGI